MNHGQFYKADQLVAAIHQDAGGIFPGFRAAHAVGRIYAGTFTPTAAAKTLSRAAHFQDTPVPATARFSGTSGDPSQKPTNVAAMALKFYLPDGTITDLIGITLPAFFARTPEEFLAFVAAKVPYATTGQPDMAKLQAFFASHPLAVVIFIVVKGALVAAQTGITQVHDHAGTGSEAEDQHWSGLVGSMMKMHDDMSAIERTGHADTDFVRLMLPHHQAAVDMARVQLLYGKDPQMRRLAQEIIADQQLEIELMQLWLKQQPVSSVDANVTSPANE
jgi:uncharacterized protein (DUF305 family)